MRSLAGRLALAFALIAVASVAVSSALAQRSFSGQFGTYLRGRGPEMGRVPGMPGMMDRMMGPPERAFVRQVQRSVFSTSLVVAALAALAGVAVARGLAAPLRELTGAASRLAVGERAPAVEVRGADELADLARTFNGMAASLSAAEAGRRQFLADVAHELRTPLAVLQAGLEAMLDGVQPPTPERLAALHTQARLLARLVSDVRDLSLAQAGSLTLQRADVSLTDLAGEVVDGLRPVAEDRGVTLALDTQPTPRVRADADRVRQILLNLLDNALRYTPAGGRVTVEVAAQAGEARLIVRDTGPGIPAEALPHVFEHFYRADASRARTTGGSGLGLAVVRHLVEAHGGHVSADSRPGEGAVFTVALPLANPA